MATYDLHQHLWPEPFIERLRARGRAPFLRDSVLTTLEGSFPVDLDAHRLERRIADLDRAGIDVAVVSLQPTLGIEALSASEREPLTATYNDGVAELVAASGGRLRALAADEIRPDFAGVCVGASRLLDPDRIAGILDELAAHSGFLFVHPDHSFPGPTRPHWWAAVVDYTATMQAAYFAWIDEGAARWPDVPVVFALLAGGAPFQLERLGSRGAPIQQVTGLQTYFETSSYGRIALELCLATFGVDRLVFGSDLPVLNPTPTMSAVQALGKAASHAICERNPESLLVPALV